MSFVKYRDNSRTDWGRESATGSLTSREDIEFGCMLRIADATEAMAKNQIQMQRDLTYYKDAYRRHRDEISRLVKQRSALRGVVTRMKRKAKP